MQRRDGDQQHRGVVLILLSLSALMITHLMAVREAARLFAELADEIIDRSPQPPAGRMAQTFVQVSFGPAERRYSLPALSERVLRPGVAAMVDSLSIAHKKICAPNRRLSVPDGWSGDVIVPPNGIPLRLATINDGSEITRMEVMYRPVEVET